MQGRRKKESIDRIRIANDRIARCLELVEVKNVGYPIKFFELAFVNFRENGVRVNNLRRRRVLRTLLSGKAHPDYNAWIDRLELFCEMVKELNYGKLGK